MKCLVVFCTVILAGSLSSGELPSRTLPLFEYRDVTAWSIQYGAADIQVRTNLIRQRYIDSPLLKTLFQHIGDKSYDPGRQARVLGLTLPFPNAKRPSWYIIRPSRETVLHGDLVRLRSCSVWVKGRNTNLGISLLVADATGREYELFMGRIRFNNWRELIWVNPDFSRVAGGEMQGLRFAGFIVYGDEEDLGNVEQRIVYLGLSSLKGVFREN
ncbi:MAG TPA: flagellar filament outer layer protein FlaA [Spirochaetota bacterium]|nr:flagellar filament outer layer protein FlaA [Spirochaetota bacterium]HPN82909.1 flagellar filament outer layer protein FlaA [Spirochaetota bacterium]